MTSEQFEGQVEDLYEQLKNLISKGLSLDKASAQLTRDQERLFGKYQQLLDERLNALNVANERVLSETNRVRYLQKRALRFGREQWYLGPAMEGSLWSHLVDLLKVRGRSATEVEMVDLDSGLVVGLLDNPSRDKFSTRGLVVGHVQSGKTGNMAAVINKAADTKYKFFLVLSGMTDQLRNQTQARLQSDVVDLATDRWMTWTEANTDERNGDFSERATGGFSFDHRNQIAVVKKNAAILRRFLAKLKNTDDATLKNTPFLIIDDECDQASVNSARYDKAITKINDLIRQILAELPKAAYVGYTATPFANVLIDTTVPEDLYPRDFIHALQRPATYFGAEKLFGRHALEGEYDESFDGFDMIRTVPAAEVADLRPAGGKAGQVKINASLQKAIRYFVMVVAARRQRGQVEANNTMLVHTSVLNSIHRQTEAVVAPYVKKLAKRLKDGDNTLLKQMKDEWEAEQEKVLSEQFDQTPVSFGQLQPFLSEAASSIKVHVENWTADDRLDYRNGPHTYLVIGGNVLARGLTLDGLSTSYFLRSSSQYDTLMQMGRWFGYREGYEDLPRVWVEDSVRTTFYDLATIEAEIRRDVARYAEEEMTPKDFAVRIRKISGMTITAPAKMRSAVPVEIGYAGTHVQTFRFKRNDDDLLRENWDAGARLISAITDCGGGKQVFHDVPVGEVVKFLSEYQAHETHKSLSRQFLVEYIKKGALIDPRVKKWSVVVVGGSGGQSVEPLGALGPVPLVIRSASKDSGEEASVKAVMSRLDLVRDLTETGGLSEESSWDDLKAFREQQKANALLLLYPIQAMSKPTKRAGSDSKGATREALNATRDVLGYAIAFPGDKQLSGTYVAANITPDLTDPTDNLEEDDQIPDAIIGPASNGEAA